MIDNYLKKSKKEKRYKQSDNVASDHFQVLK